MAEEKTAKYNMASFGQRFLAALIDGIILGLAGRFWATMFGDRGYSLFSTIAGAGYAIMLWVNWNGQTVGKKLLKIKVVQINGSKLDYRTAIIRYIGYIVSALTLGIGYLWMLWDKNKQTFHDKIAGTYVVKE